MATLYKRATPSQGRILRIIEGAIRDAQHIHPDIVISERHRRSIAKRAAGTLSSQWVDVLAETRAATRGRPDRTEGQRTPRRPGPEGALVYDPSEGAAIGRYRHARRGRLKPVGRSPLSLLAEKLGHIIGHLQRAGQGEDARALITAVRIVAAVELTRAP